MTVSTAPTAAADRAIERHSRWTRGHALLLVLTIALLTRAWAQSRLPLIITNDGEGYVQWGAQLAGGQWPAIPEVRTPGYPIFLAGVFKLFGVGSPQILFAQHLLGCLTCVLITAIAWRFAGPTLAVIPGLCCALDPWLFAHESYALTETLTITLLSAAAWVALAVFRRKVIAALTLGLLLGALCMVRPAFQILVPLFGLGWALKNHVHWRGRLTGIVLALVGTALVTTPWLVYNARRGVDGLANGFSGMQWMGLLRYRVLDFSYAIDDDLRRALAGFETSPPGWDDLPLVVQNIGGWDVRAAELAQWNRASIKANFGRYLKFYVYAVGWQLNFFPKHGPHQYDELTWYVWRLGQPGHNAQVSGDDGPARLSRFLMYEKTGPLPRALVWAAQHKVGGMPQIPLFLIAGIVTLLALRRREWALALVFAGAVTVALVHATTLVPISRYTMPVWVIWYAGVAILIGQLRDWRARTSPSRETSLSARVGAAAARTPVSRSQP